MDLIFIILTVQVVLGALDNFWHHELTEKLPSRPSQRDELALHTVREAFYALIFIGIAWWQWQGAFAWVLGGILLLEIVVTVWDFLVEDRTRKLPPFERVLHTILAVNAGAFLALFAPELWIWVALPTDLAPVDHGLWSWALTLFGIGVGIWAVRDLVAVMQLTIARIPEWQRDPIRRGEKENPQTWLITGGTGFIGRRLARTLIGRGDNVIVLARDAGKAVHMYGPQAEVVGRVADLPADRRIDTIVNLAGEPVVGGLWTARRKAALLASRVDTTAALNELIGRLERKPGLLISGSAIGYYGDHGDADLTENSPAGEGFAAEMCRAWEAEARLAEEHGVRVVRMRMGLVIDPEGGVLKALAGGARLGGGVVMGSGQQWQSWISLDDLIGLMLHTEERTRVSGAVNAVAPEALTQVDMTRQIAGSVRRPTWLRIPERVLRMTLGELSTLFLDSARVIPVQAEKSGYRFRDRTFSEALRRFASGEPAAKGEATAFFNMDCPVCGTEARMCQRQIDRNDTPISLGVMHLSDRPDLLKSYRLEPAHLSRRMYIMEPDGRMYAGIDAMIHIWRHIPAYRWRARLFGLPGIHLLASFLYETVVAPYIDGRFGVNSKRAKRQLHAAE